LVDPFVAVRSWVAQLAFNFEDARELAEAAWQSADAPKATATHVEDLFCTIAQAIPSCTFVVDGLDESWDRTEEGSGLRFLHFLQRALAHSRTRLLVVSREEVGIRAGLLTPIVEGGLAMVEYQITTEDVRSDIARFARAVVDRKLVKQTWTSLAKQKLAESLTQHSSGMFLWICLQEPRLRSSKTLPQLEQIISQAPLRLGDIYKANFERIFQQDPEDTARAISILRWVLLSFRPLMISELTIALAVPNDVSLNLLSGNLPDELDEDYANEEIIKLCGSLVEVHDNPYYDNIESKTIHLIHFSVKEFLIQALQGKSQPGNVPVCSGTSLESHNNELAMVCLRYLNLESTWAPSREVPFHMLNPGPFLVYAACYWPSHIARGAENYPEVIPLINRLFHPENLNGIKWREWFDTKSGHKSSSALFYAAHLGLVDTLKYLVQDLKVDVDLPEGPYGTALGVACENGNLEIVEMLLDAGANVNAHLKFDNADSALLIASTCGHHKIVARLLACGADIKSSNSSGLLLLLPCGKGDIEVVEQLLCAGADPNENFDFLTPLMAASSCGSLLSMEDLFASCGYKYRVHVDLSANIVRQLLARGEQQKRPEWPITCSAELIKLLIYHGAQVDWQGRFGWTALHMAAKADRVDSIQALLEGGAKIDLVDTRGRSALTKASDMASKSAIKFLLENGATPQLQTSTSFGNHLNSAAFSGSIPLLKFLLSTKQVNCNLKDDVGRNAAHFAALGGNLAILEFLQRVGTDLDTVDVTGKSLVHYAAMGCNQEILRIALSQDNHRTTSDSPGWSPLH